MKQFYITFLLSLLMSVATTNIYATEDVEIAISSDTQVRVYCSGDYGGGEIIMPFSWSSIIHKSIVALGGGLTQEEFESGWNFDGTQYSAKDVLKTNPLGNVYLAPEISEDGLIWVIDDNTILNLAYQGKVNPKTGVSTEAISTMVKLEGSPNIWVTLTIPAGSFQFAIGKIFTDKQSSYWYNRNSIAATIPYMQNNNCSFNFDFWSAFDGIYHTPDIYWFDRFNEEATTSFRFTTPAISKDNATFDADNNGQWTVLGASGDTYTLRVSSNGSRIETTSGVPIVLLTGYQNNIAEYQSNATALDILNYASNSQLGSIGSFMAYMEIVVESCYEMYVTDNSQYFNIRFQRSVVFADSNVNALCVANWDTNGDGGLTEEELAAVTDLGNVFSYNETITSFDELQYFTGLTTISDCAFEGCCALSSIEMPVGVTSIGDGAFGGCCALSSIEMPVGVTSIGISAFEGCSGLTSITIPGRVTNIGDFAFQYCAGLTSISIPDGVTSIKDCTFYNCTGLASITIPEGVTNIGEGAFGGCSSLTSIEIPSSVTTLGNFIFDGCSSLVSINISESVKIIGEGAFGYCTSLVSIMIPSSVTTIGECAFYECSSLTSVTVDLEEPLIITSDVFSNRANSTLYVPAGCKVAYEAADYWKEFKEIVELESQKYTLEITGASFTLDESHLYDRDGNEYDVTDFSYNEFYAGSYIRICPWIGASRYIREIIVNGTSIGTWTDENTAPTEYVIDNISENTVIEFRPYLREQWRYLHCVADGPGNIEMYKNDNYVGTTTYDAQLNIFTQLFEVGDVMKLVFIPDAGCTLTGLSGGEYTGYEYIDLTGNIVDNTFIFTFSPNDIVNEYGYLVRSFAATFEGPEPQTNNVLSATSTTILTGQEASLSLNLTNEDEIIMTEFYMQLPEGITIEEDEDGYPIVTINSERENRHIIEVSRNSQGLYHFLCYSSNNNAFKGNEGELFNMNLICAEGVTAGTYTATVKDIIMSDVDRNELTQSDFTFNISVMDVAMGDANGDGRINGMDIVEMVDYIMERPSNSFVFAAADLTSDGKVNGMDLVELVSLVMAQGAQAPPSALPRREGTLQTEKLDEGTLTLRGNENGGVMLGVENPDEFILAQMIVEVSDGTLTDVTTDAKHDAVWSQIGAGRYAVLAYSTRNRSFTTNNCLLTFLGCEGNVTVKDMMLIDVDREAKYFADVTYNSTTGIEPTPYPSLMGNESIYDLSGRKLETRNMELGTSPKGVYIVNGKKVVVK